MGNWRMGCIMGEGNFLMGKKYFKDSLEQEKGFMSQVVRERVNLKDCSHPTEAQKET